MPGCSITRRPAGTSAGDVRHRDLHVAQAAARPDVEMIERAGPHADQHLAGREIGIRGVLVREDLGPAVLVKPYGFHERW
jgi:hypothetical protein